MLRAFVDEPEPPNRASSASGPEYGLGASSRSILGRHASATNETHAVYARDLSIGPTRELQGVISAIFDGRFMPDAFGISYFSSFPPSPPPEVGSDACKVELMDDGDQAPSSAVVEVSSSAEESAESTDGDSSVCSDKGPEPPAKVRRFRPRIPRTEV